MALLGYYPAETVETVRIAACTTEDLVAEAFVGVLSAVKRGVSSQIGLKTAARRAAGRYLSRELERARREIPVGLMGA